MVVASTWDLDLWSEDDVVDQALPESSKHHGKLALRGVLDQWWGKNVHDD